MRNHAFILVIGHKCLLLLVKIYSPFHVDEEDNCKITRLFLTISIISFIG
jgi:hypothetical protein